jgi:DNA integrity scanning protein DisA with diadenylate cyclase activity
MYKRISTLVAYLSFLIKMRKKLRRREHIFKLVEVIENKQKEAILQIQVVNKANFFQCTPTELVLRDDILAGFSANDVRTITYLAAQYHYAPKAQVVSYRFSESIKRFLIRLKTKSQVVEESSASGVAKDAELLNALNQQDAHKIGYLAALEQIDQEREQLQEKQCGDADEECNPS